MTEVSKLYISPSVVIGSMRDNGYKNTAYALAELIDNSIQAKSACVRLVCFEKYKKNKTRTTLEIDQIAILDDGKGMTNEDLHLSLEFGGSKNCEDQFGLGKFGMGLPNSSVSQCLLTEVWSWTAGGKILYTYLDIDKIKNKEVESIPEPVEKDLPQHIKDAYNGSLPKAGTVILWSKLDRLKWKTSRSIKLHTESLIGRIYRRQLSGDSSVNKKKSPLRIAFQSYIYDDALSAYTPAISESFRANDPMYLYSDTTLPDLPNALSGVSAFDLHDMKKIPITLSSGEKSIITIRASVVKDEVCHALKSVTNKGTYIGGTIWGQHLKKNIGLSVIRADRELELITDYYINDNNLKDRWIGIEVEFEPLLDEFFGVTNNKQSATRIKYIPLDVLADEIMDEGDDFLSKANREELYLQYLKEEAPVEAQVVDVNRVIRDMIASAYHEIAKKGFEGYRTVSLDEQDAKVKTDNVNILASIADKERSDEIVEEEVEVDIDSIKGHLIEVGIPAEEVEKTIQEIIENNLRVKFNFQPGYEELFDVSTFQGFTLIRINTDHSFYTRFMATASNEEMELLNLCLAAWARMEKEAPENIKNEFIKTRRYWGRMLESYLSERRE